MLTVDRTHGRGRNTTPPKPRPPVEEEPTETPTVGEE